MSMSTHVIGIRPPGQLWEKMKAVHDSCLEANIPTPPEVEAFFEGARPDPAGVLVELPKSCASDYNKGSDQGITVKISELPADVTIVRFYNAY